MGNCPSDVRRTLGGAARLWASAEHHTVSSEWWVALSGEKSVTYNVACCQSADAGVLTDRCLQPVLDLRRPATIMLAGPGLATAQTLADLGWVTVAALPLHGSGPPSRPDDARRSPPVRDRTCRPPENYWPTPMGSIRRRPPPPSPTAPSTPMKWESGGCSTSTASWLA